MAEINARHISDLLTYAVQHAKGKQHYLVADVCDIVGRYSSSMNEKDNDLLIKYIKDLYEGECDESKKHWMELIRSL